jgi:TolA-binding protein
MVSLLPLLTLIQLAPTATAGALQTALATGDCAAALTIAQVDEDIGIRIALARCHLTTGDAATALDTLGTGGAGPLTAHAAAVEGEAWLEFGQPIEAVQALQGALESSELLHPIRERTQLLLARALLGIDDPEGASAVLKKLLTSRLATPGRIPAPGGVDPGEVRWWLAKATEQIQSTESAIPIWAAIWTHNPTSPYSAKAAERLGELGEPTPDANTTEGRTRIHQRIRTLEKLYRTVEALSLRDLLPAGNTWTTPHAMAMAAFKAKDYPRAATLLQAFERPSPDDQLHLALAFVRAGDYDSSNAVYRTMATPGHPMAELARWKLGYMAYDAGELARAETTLLSYLDTHPNGKYADAALWYRAMGAIRLGKLGAASAPLREIIRAHAGSSLVPGATYWRARIAAMSGDTVTGEQGYAEVLRRWPVSGYAYFAAHRLGKTWPTVPPATAPHAPAALLGTDWTIAQALIDAGLLAWARPHLERLVSTAKAQGQDGALALAHALTRAGGYQAAIRLARPYCTKPWKGGDPVAMQICHPGPTHMQVTPDQSIPGNLPFAIMNAESALKPEVTSPAGARGLMQLMPALATKLHAERFGEDALFHPDHLYMPALNARLGTDELNQLSNIFAAAGVEPALVLTIAGYNGGSAAVQRWLNTWPTPPEADLFTENIGYTETRRYVRRVLGYLQTYRYVYGD